MYSPTVVSVEPRVITITWQEITTVAHTGGFPVFFYWLEYLDVNYIDPNAILNQVNSIVADIVTLNSLVVIRLASLITREIAAYLRLTA